MKPSHELPRVRRRLCLAPEALEQRMVLSSGQGSTFAIMPGAVTAAGQVSTVNFKLDPSLFTAGKGGKVVIGIDVTPATSSNSSTSSTATSTLSPEVVGVASASGRMIPVQHSRYDPKVAKSSSLANQPTSAALVTLKVPTSGQAPAVYSVEVAGLKGTTGQYLLGFYLPGDVQGNGTVTQADLTTIKSEIGMTAKNSNYKFDADVNRNGKIDRQDLVVAQENIGASTKVSPVVSVNLDPNSNPANNRTTPYSTVHFAGTLTPGASVVFANNSNNGATTTATADSTGAYSIIVPLVAGSNTFKVTTMDGFGQSISGTISPVIYSPPTTSTTPTAGGSNTSKSS